MSSVSILGLLVALAASTLVLVPAWVSVRPKAAPVMAGAAAALMGGLVVLAVLGEPGEVFSAGWVPSLELQFQIDIDAYALVALAVIGGVGMAVFTYTGVYFKAKSGAVRFGAVMLLFALAMAGLVVSDDVFTLFIFWELTTFTSYLLIGHHSRLGAATRSARQAALVTGAGGLAMLGGLIVLSVEAGSSNIGDLLALGPTSSVGWLLVLVGAMTKSAQFPFQTWLPAAMAAPTPASAFLHSATMVKAGILVLGRLGPAAADVGWWTPTVVAVGLTTMVVGGYRALIQRDLKLLLANGTVSQLGLMFALIGSGVPELETAGLAVLIAHAIYKSSLFLVVGVIDSEKKTRDIGELSGLRSEMPVLFWVAVLAALSMAAVPLTLGFAAKEAALESVISRSPVAAVAVAIASALTVAYSTRFVLGAFGGSRDPARPRASEPLGLIAAPAALTAVGVALGFVPSILRQPVADAIGAVTSAFTPAPKLVLWPGLVPALWMSLAGLLIGALVGWLSLSTFDRWWAPSRSHAFDRGVDMLQTAAERLTGVFQSGSLPAYLGQILLVAVVLPFPALLRFDLVPMPPATGGAVEWLVAGLMVVAAVALLFVRRRMVAVLYLGALGYGMSALFVAAGAPDVALTQLLMETLVVAMFALALRVLPLHFAVRFPFSAWKAVVALASGVFAVLVTLAAGSVSGTGTVSEQMLARSQPDAAGSNVVNVALVDFRASDTLGEILVLGIAALGVLALVRPFGERVRQSGFSARSSPILKRGMSVIGPLLLVLAAYLLLAGHNQPGGGFAAGLVAGAWVGLRWLAEGGEGLRRALRLHPSVLIGLGLALAGIAGLGGFLWADDFLASGVVDLDLGFLGEVKVVSVLLFDTGVATVVVGSVAGAMRGLEGS